MQEVVKTPSTSTRKRRYKTSFRFSTMKQLESAREYKSSASNVTKVAKVPKRALKLPKSISESDEQDGLQTPIPFNEFEVFKGAKPMDVAQGVDLRR
jgi:hypothetical protein